MTQNNQTTTLSIGSIALIEKVTAEYNYLDRVVRGLHRKAKNFQSIVKLFIHNRLSECVSTNRLQSVYDQKLFQQLGFDKIPGDRSLYRTLERLGQDHQFILHQHLKFIQEEQLATHAQFVDFSSSYFEGTAAPIGQFGYSRDHQPGKKQFTFGIATGLNEVPSALTVQKGNVNDKTHFAHMIRVAGAMLPIGSIVIYDCGGNTKENNALVRSNKLHYLTLKQKKVTTYRPLIAQFNASEKKTFTINNTTYQCAIFQNGEEYIYLFFCETLKTLQLATKARNHKRELEQNETLLKRAKAGKPLAEYQTLEGILIAKGSLQQQLVTMENPRINGLEGFFALQSSMKLTEEKALALYKDKDKAEKLMRSIKEGTELRPIRHWSDDAIIGYVLIVFLTNVMLALTHHNSRNNDVKNTKLLKKYLNKLTLVIHQPPTGGEKHFLANISPEIQAILGDFHHTFQEKYAKAG
jgi:transposase